MAELPPGASEAEPLVWFLLNKFYLFKLRRDVKSCGRTGVVMMVNIYSNAKKFFITKMGVNSNRDGCD